MLQFYTSFFQLLALLNKVLPKSCRLPAAMIPQVIKKGKYLEANLIKIAYLPNKSNPALLSQWAIVIPKKIIKKAVPRNKVKRYVSSLISRYLNIMKKGYYLIFFLRSQRQKNQNGQIEFELKEILNRGDLLLK